MSVRLGLLAILDQGSCYGYQLRAELDRRTGSAGPINVGQIYNTLDRLERDKLVGKLGPDAEHSNYYEITEAGRAAVREWFATASEWPDIPDKVALASTLPNVDARVIVEIQRAATEQELASQPSVEQLAAGLDATRSLKAAAARESLGAQLRFLDVAERILARGVAPLPLSTDIPRRGRPAKASQVD